MVASILNYVQSMYSEQIKFCWMEYKKVDNIFSMYNSKTKQVQVINVIVALICIANNYISTEIKLINPP